MELKKIWNIPTSGIDLISQRVRTFDIDCDFIKQDSLFVGTGNSGLSAINEEAESRKLASMDVERYDAEKLRMILGSSDFCAGVRYGHTYGISALQYAQGMKKVLIDDGIEVFEATEAQEIKDHTVFTHSGSVTADQIIVAIDKIKPSFSQFSKEVFHAQTFLSISEPLSDSEINKLFPSGEQFQCWDSTLVYSYWRLTGSRRLLLGGGSAMTTFLNHAYRNENVIHSVIANFKKRFPHLKNLEFVQYWPGLIDTTRDLLPTLVRDPKASHVHFAFGIVGLPWASFCGDLIGRTLLNEATEDELKYFRYLSDRRYFALPVNLQNIVGKPALFSLNNLWTKYFQKDIDHKFEFSPDDF